MKQRDSNLDVIRALAAFCVVVNHAAESVYAMSMEQYQMIPHSSSAFYFVAFTFGRCGVPLFLLLSGYLLLPQSYDENKIKRFYKHNFLPMLGVWELWIFIYCVFLAWYYQMPFDVAQYIRRALFLEHAGLSHTWYMPMIIGMYLFLPYVANALKQIPWTLLSIMMLAVYVYLFIVPSVNLYQSMLQIPSNEMVYAQIDLSYGGNTYGLYLILGYAIARCKKLLCENKYRVAVFFAILMGGGYAWTVHAQLAYFAQGIAWQVWYNYYMMPLIGAGIFITLMNIKFPSWIELPAKRLSICSFGIYLLHDMLLVVEIRNIGVLDDKSTEVVVLAVGIYLLSYLIVEGISKIPHVEAIFLKKE